MLHSHYPLQALLYSVVLHRYLRWRLPGYDPERHLGGILYLYVRGMCGPETPEVDGQPCGVFAWHPPAAMVVELSDLLDGRVGGGGGLMIDDRRERTAATAGSRWRHRPARATFNRAERAQRRRRPRRHPARRDARRRPTSRCCSPPRWPSAPCARARSASTSPPSPTSRSRTRPCAEVAALARARRPGSAAVGREPAGARRRCCGWSATRALPRPLLARGGPGLRRPGRPHPTARRPRSTPTALDAGAAAGLPRRRVRRAARRRPRGRLAGGPPC